MSTLTETFDAVKEDAQDLATWMTSQAENLTLRSGSVVKTRYWLASQLNDPAAHYLKNEIDDFVKKGDGTNALRLSYPAGGATTLGSVVGAIKVTLPVGFLSNMVTIKLAVFDYATGESFEVFVAGYTYSLGGVWHNPTAYTVGSVGNDRVFTVRYGESGGKACFYVGEITSAWSNLRVTVTEVTVGFVVAYYDAWSTGWNVSLETVAFENVTKSVDADQVGRTIGRNLILHEGMDTGWLYPTLLNGWVDYGGVYAATAFRRSPGGVVEVRVMIKSGIAVVNTPVMILPAGFRPAGGQIFIGESSSVYARVNIDSAGVIEIITADSSYVSINLMFKAEG